MSQQRFRQVRELFDAALEVAPEARFDWCAKACVDDPSLLVELLRLLERDAALKGSNTTPAVGLVAAALNADSARQLAGARAGRYTLVEEIGQGGMGRVFLAVREDAGVRQEVAVKLLRREMIDTAMLGRFQTERRILAGLNHPAIARLLDFGETTEGIPFVAMELVRGESIIAYCARLGLGVRERLQVFRQVLGAVAHAHRNLIVHRDIKPANVLVDASGNVKLLDFGIAKPLQAQGDATATNMRYLTPNYAAPEQFAGGPVSVMSDVYALGALLYELLSGRPPLALDGISVGEIERRVLQHPPEALERAAGQGARAAAALGRADLPAWRRSLRGDLDAIVHKALRKEPNGRYLSVEALDADIQCYLERRPVLASGNRRAYRIGKFVQRHRLLLGVVVCALLAVAGALATALRQASVAAAERDGARAAVTVLSESFRAADPLREASGHVTASQILLVAARQTAALRESQPQVHAALVAEIGEAELALGVDPGSDSELDAALAWTTGSGKDMELARRLRLLSARQAIAAQRMEAADQALKLLEASDGDDPEVLSARAHFLSVSRRVDEAVAVATRAEQALATERGSARHAEAVWQLAEAQRLAGDADGAIATLDRLVEIYDQAAASTGSRALITRLRRVRLLLATARADSGVLAEAAMLVETLGRQYARDSTVMGIAHTAHAQALELTGDRTAAIAAHRRAVEAFVSIYGRGHPNTLRASFNLAEQLAAAHAPDAAAAFEALFEDTSRAGLRDSPLGVYFRHKYARQLIADRDLDSARRVLLPAGFDPDLDALRPGNREGLADDLVLLFGPFDCAASSDRGAHPEAKRIACAAYSIGQPADER